MALDAGLDVVEWILVAALVIMVVGMVIWYLWSIEWALTKKPMTGPESMVGKEGIAVADFSSTGEGEVNIDGVFWKAKLQLSSNVGAASPFVPVSKGDQLVVVGSSSVTLVVKRQA